MTFFQTKRGLFAAIAGVILVVGLAVWALQRPSQKVQQDTPAGQDTLSYSPSPEKKTEGQEAAPPALKTTALPGGLQRYRLVELAKQHHKKIAAADLKPKKQAKALVKSATQAYASGNFVLTAAYLQSDAEISSDDFLLLLRAHARFETGQYQGASLDFSILEKNAQYQKEAQWNYMLCMMAMGKVEELKTVLNELAADPASPFNAQAKRLLSELNLG